MSGRFITFEGIDGAGKSTHIEGLARLLRERGRTVTVTREPGGTPLAENLRGLVLHQAMDSLTEALLVFAARRDHLLHTILPALRRGEVVLCDRFTDSSFAYQGGGQGLDLEVLAVLERWVQGGWSADGTLLQPDLTLWFVLPPVTAAARLAQARSPDKFEAKGEAFFARVSEGFEQRAKAHAQRFRRIRADASREAVWAQVEQALLSHGRMA